MTGDDAEEIATAPKVNQFAADIWQAWIYLTGSRQYTMGGAAPIAISEILAYAQYQNISDSDDRDRLLQIISSMDHEYLSLANKKDQ